MNARNDLIENPEELNALPDKTVIRDRDGEVLEADRRRPEGMIDWWATGSDEDYHKVKLPVIVLWTPDDDNCQKRTQAVRSSSVPELTLDQFFDTGWGNAWETDEEDIIPPHTPLVIVDGYGDEEEITFYPKGLCSETEGGPNVRTLNPFSPLIPADCNRVFASVEWNLDCLIWIRETDNPDCWRAVDGTWGNWNALTSDLIDPKPVPEEER